jgi:nitroreductase/Pyruvate/2-oxoacid:ferredoxin oxidoreductase delta subunit
VSSLKVRELSNVLISTRAVGTQTGINMVKIDTEKCTGCAQCVKDCFPRNIVIENAKAKTVNENCMRCGHCVAVCPKQAVEITEYDMADVVELNAPKFSAEELLSLIKGRRSIRQYKDIPVEQKLIQQMIEAGRYTATGGNRQELSFIVVDKEMEAFRSLVMDNLAEKSRTLIAADKTPPQMKYAAGRWLAFVDEYKENIKEKDRFFFGAPCVILITGDNAFDAGLAASNMELVTCVNNLGVLYSGAIVMGASNEKIQETVGVPNGKKVLMALVIGYPDVLYKCNAPRKKADIIWS